MEYKGYKYSNYVEVEFDLDNSKIYHEVVLPGGHTKVLMDWSPYSSPTESQFKLWIDLGRPGRVGTGPLTEDDLLGITESTKYDAVDASDY